MPRPVNTDLPRLLLEAALGFIDARGHAAFSVRELSAEVDYSVTAVYRCFDGRDALLSALRARLLTGLGLQLGAPVGGSAEEALHAFGTRLLAWATQYPARFRFVFLAPGSRGPRDPMDPLRAAIRRGVARAGVDGGRHVDVRVDLVLALLIGTATLIVRGVGGEEADDHAARWFEAEGRALLRGILEV